MKLISLRLVNFGKYEDFTLKYAPGITGILGKNGTGKSTISDYAQYFAITGETPTKFNKKDLIRWKSEFGFTALTFESGGIVYTLTRYLQNNKASLTGVSRDTGEEALNISDIKNINKQMLELLGMSFDVFREACFVPQGSFIDVVNMRHGERIAWLQRITGLKRAEDIRILLQEAINSLPASSVVRKELDKIRTLHWEASTELIKIRLNKRNLLSKYGLPDNPESVIPEYKELQTKLKSSNYIQKEQKYNTELQQLQEEIDSIQNSIQDMGDLSANILSAEETSWLRVYDEKIKLDTALKKFENLSEISVLDIEQQEKAAMALQIAFNLRYNLQDGELCPVCDCIVQHAEAKKQAIGEISGIVKELQSLKEMKHRLSQRDSLQSRIQNLDSIPDNVDIQALIHKSKQLENTRTSLSTLQKYNSRLVSLETKKSRLQQALQQLEQTGSIADDEHIRISKYLLTYETYTKELTELQLEEARVSAIVSERQKIKNELEASQKHLYAADDLRALFERSKDILHRDNLPRLVMQRIIHSINEKLEFYLSKFSTEFTAYLSESMDFVCDFITSGDASKSAYTALSGGQKVALALAFRFALADILGSTIPLMVLDEPTIFLDTDNIEAVCQIFKDIRSFAEKGVYVFILTHDEELHKAFTRTLEL